MQNWEVLQKKISEMNKEEFLEFITNGDIPMVDICRTIDVYWDCDEKGKCIGHTSCSHCEKAFLMEEYREPKQEKWIVHRTLRMNGMETYVGYSDDDVDDGCRKYFLGTFDGKNISGYLHKLKAHKFDYLEAIVLREQLNKQRAYKQYIWVISKVEE